MVIAVAGILTALTLVSEAAHAKRPRCSLSGTNLAHSRTIKVVKRVSEDEFLKLVGCMRPNGRQRVLVELEQDYTNSASATVDAVAGTWLVIRTSTSNQYGGTSAMRYVDLRTGRNFPVSAEHYDIGQPSQGNTASAFDITARGFMAAFIDDLAPTGRGAESTVTRRHVMLFTPQGTGSELDAGGPLEIDPKSLVLDTHTVLWSHGGQIRYARF